MTSELEKQFFNTFNLTKYKLVSKYNKLLTYGPFESLEDVNTVAKGLMDGFIIEEVYPQITDRIYLELYCLICIAQNTLNSDISVFELNTKSLKETILKRLIWIEQTYKNKNIKQQVQALFKESR